MKTLKTILGGIRGWAEDFAEGMRGYDLGPGCSHEATRVFLTPLGPAVIPVWRAGTGRT